MKRREYTYAFDPGHPKADPETGFRPLPDPRTTLARAVRKHERARLGLEQAARDARALGVPVAEIARIAGVSRPTIYLWIKS